jgi:hypothetical protein
MCKSPQSNNGMHPTADTPPVKFLRRLGRRVMPGVMLLPLARAKDVMRKVAFSLASILWLLLLPSVGLACTCTLDIPLLRKPEEQQIKIARNRAKAVFLGRVVGIDVDEQTKTYRARIKVQRSWKNVGTDEVVVSGTTTCCVCEYIFHVGESYLVYASEYDRAKNEYGTSICTRSRPLADAGKDLQVLGEGKKHAGEQTAFSGDAKHNNGMHPTRDTLPVMFRQGGRRAGDAGR